MAENKKSFILYADLITVVKKLVLKDRDNGTNYAGELFLHILEYINDNEPIPIDFIIEMAFEPIKLQLKRDLEKWDSERNKRSEAGRKGGLARARNAKQSQAPLEIVKPAKANQAVTDTVTVTVTDTVIKKNIEDRKRDFTKSLQPYLEEFGEDLLTNFFEYWAEHGENDRKMRFEKEKSFGIKRRLTTWKKNQKGFKNGEIKQNTKTWEAPEGDGGFKIHRT